MIEKQIELEKRMTELCVDKFRKELDKNLRANNFANTQTGNTILSLVLNDFLKAIDKYLDSYAKGKAVRCTVAAETIEKVGKDVAGYISAKVIFNSLQDNTVQGIYRAIGQALEDEYKMQKYRDENKHYYKSIQEDLNSRGAKANRKKYITMNMFQKKLDFYLDKWSITAKVQTGMVLTNLFIESTNLVSVKDWFKGKKQIRSLEATDLLRQSVEDINTKLEVLEPFFLPMICQPKEWSGIFEGGYISPYLKRNKVIKNNNKEYLTRLNEIFPTKVYEALNTIQATAWQIDNEVLEVVKLLWEEGQEVAGLPKREDDIINPFPYPEITSETILTENQKEDIKRWKRETYETHKKNVAQRSIRILTSQMLRIAEQFKDYKSIWFPYQMDFRGRMYPIPVLLHPQGSDLAKGLLKFARGKPLDTEEAVNWFKIHGANVYGYDKASYMDRIKYIDERAEEILSYAKNPLVNRGWTMGDKPIQFLAWCFEFSNFIQHPKDFVSHIPIQLDGTCNGLQHYSALLRDIEAGKAVNLLNSDKPNDIYKTVAEKLRGKLNELCTNTRNDNKFDDTLPNLCLNLGITRKLTKRPVMVLPYGGSRLSCREYIEEYFRENYSTNFLWQHFKVGNNPSDCIYKVSFWLSTYLWEAIRETLTSAIVGMDYIKSVTREVLKHQSYLEWFSPIGLLIHQAYQKSKKREIKTELFGKHIKTKFMTEANEGIDKQRQLNGVCPNFIHSLDASCLMLWILKCKEQGITSFMSVHDCYGTHASDTEISAKLLREAFVEIYKHPVLENFTADMIEQIDITSFEQPQIGTLDINDVLDSEYFFN